MLAAKRGRGKGSGALLAPAALAVVANSLVNSNLVAGVASPWIAWPLFGALLKSEEDVATVRHLGNRHGRRRGR